MSKRVPELRGCRARIVTRSGAAARDERRACLLPAEVDVGGLLVEADASRLQLRLEDRLVRVRLGGVEHHEDQVGGFGDGNDLPPATLALRGPLDDSGQIEQLDLGALVVDYAGDTGERREFVRRRLALRPREKCEGCASISGETDVTDSE
jgi:hypothetical protein